jgi:hypothetical protein
MTEPRTNEEEVKPVEPEAKPIVIPAPKDWPGFTVGH